MLTEISKRAIHLDNIRNKKNIMIKDLCENICGERQYRKYTSGESNISEKRLMEFCERIGISARDFYFSLYEKDIYDYVEVYSIYKNIESGKFNTVKSNIETQKKKKLNTFNSNFLKLCKLKYEYLSKKITVSSYISKLKLYCNYPKCFKSKAFDFIDIVSLLEICKLDYGQSTKTINLLKKILCDETYLYLSSEVKTIFPTIYSNVSIILGRLGEIDESIDLAFKGVNFCKKYNVHKSLTRLYYSISMGYLHKREITNAEKFASLCLANAISLDNPSEVDEFYTLLLKDFSINPYELIKRTGTKKDQISP